MKSDIYVNGQYSDNNPEWHQEDSAWKADQIVSMLRRNGLTYNKICEVGCGAGEILHQMSKTLPEHVTFDGYEIAPQAYEIAKQKESDRLHFHLEDVARIEENSYDILLLIDVMEHVPDYMGFVQRCAEKAKYKVFHIPLDIHVSSVVRATLTNARDAVGHLHYFTADTALAVLRDTGLNILDFIYTDGAIALYKQHPSARRLLANIFRSTLSKVSVRVTARLLGGYSLLVLTE